MRIRNFFFSLPLILIAASLFIGCDKNTTDVTIPTNTVIGNTPVNVSATNAFTYTIDANGFTTNAGQDLSFTSDSLVYTIVVTGYSSGSATIEVTNQTGAVMMHDSVTTNKVSTIVDSGKGIPKRCMLNFSNFTGKLNFVLAYRRNN